MTRYQPDAFMVVLAVDDKVENTYIDGKLGKHEKSRLHLHRVC